VLGQGLTELLQDLRGSLGEDEPLCFFIDKHGGRNTYAPLLQHAIGKGLVVARQESAARSVYAVLGIKQSIQITFQPRADSEHFCVALASMVSKYLREMLMREFNRFWQSQVPGLQPTAGYPGDAPRFLEAIRPAFERLKLSENAVWRRK
jgi:ribonuclease HIII